MKIQKWISSLLTAALIVTSLPSGFGAASSKANAIEPATTEVAVSGFESEDDVWDVLIGSGGRAGSLESDRSAPAVGDAAGKLALAFNPITTITLEHWLGHKTVAAQATQLFFWVKSPDVTEFDLILYDSAGTNHQQTIRLAPTGDWQRIAVDSFASGLNYRASPSAGAGRWEGPLRKISMRVTRTQMPGKSQGTIWFDDVRAKVPVPNLAIVQTHVGNVFPQRDATFDIVTAGDAVAWSVVNAWQEPVAAGTLPVADGQVRLHIPNVEDGYYRLRLSASRNGANIGTLENTFAVVPAPDLASIEDSPFGVQTHYGINWGRASLPLVKNAGFKNVRDSFYWSEVERTKGVYAFNPKFSLPLQMMQDYDMNVLHMFGFKNPNYDNSYTPYTDEAHLAYGEYVKAMMQRYGSQIAWGEMWNEFDLPYFGGDGPAASRAEVYANLLKRGYEAAKSVDPHFQVVGGATSGIPMAWLETLFQHDGLNHMDILSVHPYRYPKTPEGFLAEVDALDDLVRTYNDGETIPIWFSGIGWPTHLNPRGVDELTQAAYLIRTYVLGISAEIDKIFWYDLMNKGTDKLSNEPNFGIVHHTSDELGPLTPKPAYAAAAAMTSRLNGATLVGQDVSGPFHRYSFERDGDVVHVLWSLEPTTASLTASSALQVTDMLGGTEEYVPAEGRIHLALTGHPVFVKGALAGVEASTDFAFAAAPAYRGAAAAATLTVNDLQGHSELNARIEYQGHVQEIVIDRTGSYAISLPPVDALGERRATVALSGPSGAIASLSAMVELMVSERAEARHALRGGVDVLEVTVENKQAIPRKVTAVDWKIGTSEGRHEADIAIEPDASAVIPLSLEGVPHNALLTYELNIAMEDGAEVYSDGTIKRVPASEMNLLPFRSADAAADPFGQAPVVDLLADVNSRLKQHDGPDDFSGKVKLSYDKERLYIDARVKDDVFYQPHTGDGIWEGDGIQFAVSAGTPGEHLQWYEFGMALTPAGPQLYRWMATPGKEPGPVESPELHIERVESSKETVYRLALPWEELSPIDPKDGLLSLSVLVNENDNDGTGRGYVEWGRGIGSTKQSSLFKPMMTHWFDGVAWEMPTQTVFVGTEEPIRFVGRLGDDPAALPEMTVEVTVSDSNVADVTLHRGANGDYVGTVVGKTEGAVTLQAVARYAGQAYAAEPIRLSVAAAPPVEASRSGWTNEDVAITVTNGLEGAGRFEYAIGDGEEWFEYTAPIVVAEEGVTPVRVRYADRSGRRGAASAVEVRIDRTAPLLALSGDRTYTVTESVYVSCTATDSLSGIAEPPCREPLVNGTPAYLLEPGQHPIVVAATDRAGNGTTVSGAYTIAVSSEGLAALTADFLASSEAAGNGGVLHSLLRKLEQGNLNAYRNEVNALRGKRISERQADALLRLAGALPPSTE